TVVINSAGGSATATVPMRGFVTVTGRVIARVRDRNGNLNDNPVFAPVELLSSRFYDGNPQSTDPEAGPVFLDGPVFHSRTNSNPVDGTFTFTLVHGGTIRVTARNAFYGDKSHDFGTVIGDGTRGPVDLVFDGNLGFVDGFLLNADGTPIVGGRVTLTGAGVEMEALSRAATVDVAAGYFVFPLVPFRSPLRLEYRGAVLGKDRFAEGYASISAAAPLARVTLRALPLGTVTTRVVKRSGNDYVNVPNAQVLVKETAGPLRQFVKTTDANGLATFDDVTAGAIAVSAKEGLLAAKASLLGAGEGFRVEAVLTLTGVGRVTGTVREPGSGVPAGNVNVVLHSLGGAGFPIGPVAAATTDASGTYDFPDLPAGPGAGYRLFAEDGRTLRSGSSGSFPLQVDEVKAVDVSFVPIGVVTGRVTTFDGAVIYPGITVRVKSGDGPYLEATTGVDGVYRVEGVAAGLVSATATDELTGLTANAQGTLETEGQVLSLDLRTRPSGRVQGVVRRADGTPVALTGPQPSVRLDSRISQTVLSGAYDFTGVDATIPFQLTATEPVAPFHIGQLSGTVGAGEVKQVDVSYGPIGSL
ncbi:MAG: carboxypeptidase regulatory-like domain-containing protein, partial [Acidobacteria bacterium]|nr:carboxypeptidase regulatory-like domain-containing protein [Acidobacteriota bacterium]